MRFIFYFVARLALGYAVGKVYDFRIEQSFYLARRIEELKALGRALAKAGESERVRRERAARTDRIATAEGWEGGRQWAD